MINPMASYELVESCQTVTLFGNCTPQCQMPKNKAPDFKFLFDTGVWPILPVYGHG